MASRSRRLSLWLPVFAYMAAIFYLSSLNQAPVPGGMSDWTAHVLGYAGLGIVCTRALAGGIPARVTWRIGTAAAALAVAYGITDEVHQLFVPGRYADWRDLVADAVGAGAGIVACWAFDIIGRRAAAGGRPRHDS